MDKLSIALKFSLILLVLCIVCIIIVDKGTLEFYLTIAATAICVVIATVSLILIKRKK